MKTKREFIITIIIVLCVLGVGLFVSRIPSALGQRNVSKETAARKKEITEILNNNPEFRNFVEQELYAYEDEISIKYEAAELEFRVNNNKEEIDEKTKESLISIFELLDFNTIYSNIDTHKKSIKLVLGNESIDKNNVYNHSLTYRKSGGGEGELILPNWYYDVKFYN